MIYEHVHTCTVCSLVVTHTCILTQRPTYVLLRHIYNHGPTEAYTYRQRHIHAKTHVA